MYIEKKGYIFSRYEVVYISKLMGANYLFGIDLGTDNIQAENVKKAYESLAAKGYIFSDFSGNMILNEELAEYFMPVVFPDKIILLRKKTDGSDGSIVYFVRDGEYTSVEYNGDSGSYIFTLTEETELLCGDMMNYISLSEDIEDGHCRFIINVDQFKILSSLADENADERIESFISDWGIKNAAPEEIKKLFSGKKDCLSISFFYNYKKNPADFNYLMYYITDEHCWKMQSDKDYGENIKFSSATEDSMSDDIDDFLYKYMGIKSKNSTRLFFG